MTTLTDFLLERIAEDEAGEGWGLPEFGPCYDCGGHDPARVLAECAAHRQIVEIAGPARDENGDLLPGSGIPDILRALAAVYANHPDYRAEWAL